MIRLLVASCFLVLVAVCGCSDKPTEVDGVRLGEPFVLKLGQTVEVPEAHLTLRFERVVYDGRCGGDPDVYCIWEGMAEIELLADLGPVGVQLLPTIMGFVEDADTISHRSVFEAGYRFTLRQLDPLPSIHAPPPQDYTVISEIADADGQLVPECPPVQIVDMSPSTIHIAPFFLHEVEISGDEIALDIGYSGGCQSHYHFLFMSPATFMESNPVQANLYLRHVDNDDTCEAYVRETTCFDIRPIAEYYEQLYGELGPIILNVHEYLGSDSMRVVSVTYTPAEVEGVKLGEAFTITSGEHVTISDAGLIVRFDEVLFDYRCPDDPLIHCFWEGMAGIQLTADFGPAAFVVRPTILGYVDNDDTIRHRSVFEAGYRFTLRQLDPLPSIHAPAPQGYTAIIEIALADAPVAEHPPVQIVDSPHPIIHMAPFFLHNVSITADTIALDSPKSPARCSTSWAASKR